MAPEKYDADFLADYRRLTENVQLAQGQFIPERLMDWFALLDGHPEASRAVRRLEQRVDFDQWWRDTNTATSSSPRLNWPHDHTERLAMRVLFFRAVARDVLNVALMGFNFMRTSRDPKQNAADVINQLFKPMSGELLRHIRQEAEAETAPASDRIVPLNHNSPEYREAVEALNKLENTLRTANDYPDDDEKSQRVAEVSAARRLLQAVRVRIQPLIELLRPLVAQYSTTLKTEIIGKAVAATIAALNTLLGRIFG